MSEELSAELRAKYPTAKYVPDPDCSRCHGKGEWYCEPKRPSFIKEGWRPCMCIFIEHQYIPLVRDVIHTVIEQDKARGMMHFSIEIDPTLPEGMIKAVNPDGTVGMLENVRPDSL